jgi:hypothetical protein
VRAGDRHLNFYETRDNLVANSARVMGYPRLVMEIFADLRISFAKTGSR